MKRIATVFAIAAMLGGCAPELNDWGRKNLEQMDTNQRNYIAQIDADEAQFHKAISDCTDRAEKIFPRKETKRSARAYNLRDRYFNDCVALNSPGLYGKGNPYPGVGQSKALQSICIEKTDIGANTCMDLFPSPR